MKQVFALIMVSLLSVSYIRCQITSTGAAIDLMLINGQYDKVIDTCRIILGSDRSNAFLIYKMGLAFENMMQNDSAILCFTRASAIDPENKAYSFHLAKCYYLNENYKKAEPLLLKLHHGDSTRWLYGYYLTNIYMSEKWYDEALEVLFLFNRRVPENCNIIDRIAMVYLKKGDIAKAIIFYKKSLTLNYKNPAAISNLAYLYCAANLSDTALVLLDSAIATDTSEIDLYARRAQIYYSRDSLKYYNKGLKDYLSVLASGDSAFYYLKMAGYGYFRLGRFNEAVRYLTLANKADSTDHSVNIFLGKSYQELKKFTLSIKHCKKAIEILDQYQKEYETSFLIMAESQAGRGLYRQAAESYLSSIGNRFDLDVIHKVAFIYDEQLKDSRNAVITYQRMFDNLTILKKYYTTEYISQIKARLEWLKNNPAK